MSRFPSCLTMLVTVAACAGCGLTRPYPERSLHVISAGPPPDSPVAAGRAVLRVETIRVARPFDSTGFVYRMGPSKFTTDYYNGFVASPDRVLAGDLTTWLAGAGVFGAVIEGASAATYHFSLETNVTALYGDYADVAKPQAVIEARFFLVDQRDGAYRVAFQRSYRRAQPLPGTTPDQLVEGWSAAYRDLLTALVQDLRLPPVAELAKLDRAP